MQGDERKPAHRDPKFTIQDSESRRGHRASGCTTNIVIHDDSRRQPWLTSASSARPSAKSAVHAGPSDRRTQMKMGTVMRCLSCSDQTMINCRERPKTLYSTYCTSKKSIYIHIYILYLDSSPIVDLAFALVTHHLKYNLAVGLTNTSLTSRLILCMYAK